MLEKAVRICDAKFGTIYLADDGETFTLWPTYDTPPEFFAEPAERVAIRPGTWQVVSMQH